MYQNTSKALLFQCCAAAELETLSSAISVFLERTHTSPSYRRLRADVGGRTSANPLLGLWTEPQRQQSPEELARRCGIGIWFVSMSTDEFPGGMKRSDLQTMATTAMSLTKKKNRLTT